MSDARGVQAEDMALKLPHKTMFNKIVALDNVYHYPSKAAFFADAVRVLPAGGRVGVTDVVLREGAPAWVRLALSAANIPRCNQWTVQRYGDELADAGLVDVEIESIGADVLPKWVPAFALPHLDYVVVAATVPGNIHTAFGEDADVAPRRLKVAIIGSGLGGLSARDSHI